MVVEKKIPIKVVLGPRKCGTTTLHSLLSQHPQIAVPSPLKEAHIFDHQSVGAYELRKHFGKSWTEQTKGIIDVATHYFSRNDLWPNIAGSEGLIGVVVLVRDPVERTVSHCMHQMRINNLWNLRFTDIVERHPEVLTDSLYSVAVGQIKAYFGESNLRLIRFEKLAADPLAVVSALCSDFDLVEAVPPINLDKKHMNRGLKPRFSWAYTAARGAAKRARRVIGDSSVERLKEIINPIWPASDHTVIKGKILKEIEACDIGQELGRERKFVADLLEDL